ncbi:23S rRNA (uracil(1939)-C(5))-methyltransferase RlmD [Budviciaceae bacterium CWB-B4]|uniref:23S rRNA (uracil(1939)-C(5))-methyltransferase RlmD n=1 Tax=Limnobaculum xujianqingii TaxID=2738837 RepID=A0A9D7AG51_9GAMM|nr:23S rRNA (uracil(1939)-C(5))-methyltransferase RlmD [Limnobaculum xujianqingii]MBK5072094.1 23S rRNA (uracil(1939)-C(5))-methyltransferase RlmD [Limnobaculum xujianqingii]MBK5175403.1 23S rRNA (uracil(1939)-C(5))-methyltransferase RlmD [Limnobaculum xujianqingii]
MAQFYSPGRRKATPQTINVIPHELDTQGQGVARDNGKTIFISGALPQEQVEAQIYENKRNYSKAKAIRILSPSPQRMTPPCSHYGICGGCNQQHVSTDLQHSSKSKALSQLFKRETGLDPTQGTVIFAQGYHYRRRARLGLQYQVKQQRLQMGFRQKASNDLVEMTECPILVPELEQLLVPLKDCLSALSVVKKLGHAELVMADNGPLLVLRHLAPLSGIDCQRLLQFAEYHQIAIYLAGESDSLTQLVGEDPYYQVDGLTLGFNPRDFIQVNAGVNQLMVEQALTWLELQPTDRVLDLFCGMGNFTLPIAKRALRVTGVEGVEALVARGQQNARINGLSNVEFLHHNLEQDVSQQPWARDGFDKVLLDPARAGAAEAMAQIVSLNPERIVYVSCNPQTLVEDSKVLLSGGYQLNQLRMLDMFPQTGHIESMALFIKS